MAFSSSAGGGSGDMSASTYDTLSTMGNGFQHLGSSAEIDATSVGDTLLVTVPVGKKLWITDYITECTAYDTIGSNASYNMGYTGAAYDDYFGGGFVSVSSNVGQLASNAVGGWIQTTFTDSTAAPAGTAIYFRVASADTGTALAFKIHLFGLLLDA